MESSFLTFVLVSSFVVSSSHTGIPDQDDVVVAREGTPTTLICTDRTARGAVTINWKVKSFGADEWKLVLFASESKEFSGAALKPSMELTDPNFQDTGVFSLSFLPKMEDSGLYSCLIKQQERKLKERIILLAILKVTVVPAAPVLQLSTLRLIASVNPESAISRITWAAPGGVPMKSERHPNTGTVAKLPRVQTSDSGAYVCIVQTQGNNSKSLFAFNVDVTVDADNTASFTNVTHGPTISTATQAQIPFIITCPFVQGDFVLLWKQPSGATRHSATQPMYQYDRWRAPTKPPERSKKLQLAGPPYNKDTGSFAFQLTPEPKDGGLYICDVYLNDNAFSQRTLLSVLKVTTRRSPSKLELQCTYTELSQVQSAKWRYQDTSRQLHPFSTSPGRISIILPMPITSDSAGNYTCTLQLKNGQTIWATQAVTLPQESGSVTTPSPPPPSLFALLLLVPLVAAAVSVLLWRQKHISDRGIEQSLSGHSGEVENIYENPEDIRQAPPEGSVYMDLKPRGEDDVYKELERCEQCQS